MKLSKIVLATAGLVLVYFILGTALYSSMPEVMASHWDAAGQVNGTISRFWGVFLFPLFSLSISLILLAVPRIDPLRANIQKFKGYYYGFIIAFQIYFLYIYMLTLVWNLGFKFDFSTAVIPSIGFLMFFLGILISKAKRNFFIGIRTPWTLSSDEVWDRTHHVGGIIFKVAGLIVVLLAFAPAVAIYSLIIIMFGTTLGLVVYSYVLYRKLGLPPQPPIGRN